MAQNETIVYLSVPSYTQMTIVLDHDTETLMTYYGFLSGGDFRGVFKVTDSNAALRYLVTEAAHRENRSIVMLALDRLTYEVVMGLVAELGIAVDSVLFSAALPPRR